MCGKKFRVRGDLKRHANIHERNKTKKTKIDESSNSSNSNKNDLFGLEDNSTLQSRSTDTLDHLVSVIENNDATFTSASTSESFKKRNFAQFINDKNIVSRLDSRTGAIDCSAVIVNYSNDHLMNK